VKKKENRKEGEGKRTGIKVAALICERVEKTHFCHSKTFLLNVNVDIISCGLD